MNKVELLAPAGNFETHLAVIKAGADAVYLSGKSFGARAYANNFDNEELISAIKVAHLFGVKVYLTVNTLIKEKEKEELVPFLKPLVECGLDAVIVQDLGALLIIHENFPNLSIHASTQMSIVSYNAVKTLKEYGCNRIVPARECSLDEIKLIKEKTGVEIESFIHGAICYCYSGQCLLSSMLGGRSGNRGRCAQPCRLTYSYEDEKKEAYLLSMKDMCTINILPQLIDAGIDSFKIEGRMKKSVYAAGVCAMYRKYIDEYYEKGCINVSEKDINILKNLYIRSEIGEGYYDRHNGKEMITLKSPAYNGSDENILNDITQKYIDEKPYLVIDGEVQMHVGKPLSISLSYDNNIISVDGPVCEAAKKAPVSKEKLYEQINKTGDTYFKFGKLSVETDDMSFLPIGAINETRRAALERLYEELTRIN